MQTWTDEQIKQTYRGWAHALGSAPRDAAFITLAVEQMNELLAQANARGFDING